MANDTLHQLTIGAAGLSGEGEICDSIEALTYNLEDIEQLAKLTVELAQNIDDTSNLSDDAAAFIDLVCEVRE